MAIHVTPEELRGVVERQARYIGALQTRLFVAEAKLEAAEAELATLKRQLAEPGEAEAEVQAS